MFSTCIRVRAEGPRTQRKTKQRPTNTLRFRRVSPSIALIGFQPPSRVVSARGRWRRRWFYGFLMRGKKNNKRIVFHKSTKSPPRERPSKISVRQTSGFGWDQRDIILYYLYIYIYIYIYIVPLIIVIIISYPSSTRQFWVRVTQSFLRQRHICTQSTLMYDYNRRCYWVLQLPTYCSTLAYISDLYLLLFYRPDRTRRRRRRRRVSDFRAQVSLCIIL